MDGLHTGRARAGHTRVERRLDLPSGWRRRRIRIPNDARRDHRTIHTAAGQRRLLLGEAVARNAKAARRWSSCGRFTLRWRSKHSSEKLVSDVFNLWVHTEEGRRRAMEDSICEPKVGDARARVERRRQYGNTGE